METKPQKPNEIEQAVFDAIYANRDLQEVAERWEEVPISMRRVIFDIVMFAN